MKSKKEYYKNIKNIILKNKEELVSTIRIEKEFPIEVIASTFENRLLIDYETLKDFWCFITNEDVHLGNIDRFASIIENEVLNQYPYISLYNFPRYESIMSEEEIKEVIKWYKTANGDKIKIKSLKKGYTKTLKKQD